TRKLHSFPTRRSSDLESEGADRTFHLPPGQEQLIREMGAINKNVVVVITAGGAVDMNRWIDRAPAALQAWYPGQEGGTALAEIRSEEHTSELQSPCNL